MKTCKRTALLILAFATTAAMIIPGGISAEKASASSDNSGSAYVSNEVIVDFKNDVSQKQVEKTAEAEGASDVETLNKDTNTMLVTLDSGTDEKEAAADLADRSDVSSAQPNYIYTVDSTPDTNDTYAASQWNLDYMDVPEAWDFLDRYSASQKAGGNNLQKVTIATIDTGANTNHYDLQANLDKAHCVKVSDTDTAAGSTAYKTYTVPKWSHGTSTTGIIAATSNNGKGIAGIAAGNSNNIARVMAINVFSDSSYSSQASASTSDIIKGLDYAYQNSTGPLVINMSLGHAADSTDYAGVAHDDSMLEKTINEIVENPDSRTVAITCSAGNKNSSLAWYPSDFDDCISVINTDHYTDINGICRHSTSNYGEKKDISAPGTGVYTTKLAGTVGKSTGTSMAAPSVAAVAAMMLYVNPKLSAKEVKDILYSTATDLYATGYDIYTGYGNVNAYRAVAKAAGVTVSNYTGTLSTPKVKVYSAGSRSLSVTWQDIAWANKYYIYRSASRNGTYAQVKTLYGAGRTSWKDTGRIFNKKYYYKVKVAGTSTDGKRAVSALSSASYARARSAVPSFTTTGIDYKTIRISWKKAAAADGYRLYRSTSKSSGYKLIYSSSGSSGSSYKDQNLKPGEKYYYAMKSYIKKNGRKYYTGLSAYSARTAKPASPTLRLTKEQPRSAVLACGSINNRISGLQKPLRRHRLDKSGDIEPFRQIMEEQNSHGRQDLHV